MNEVTVEDLGCNNFYITHLYWILRFIDLKKFIPVRTHDCHSHYSRLSNRLFSPPSSSSFKAAGGIAHAQAMAAAMSASSAVVTPPRRGRGSRGGGLNRGRRLGLKLKRLEGGAAGDFGVVSGGGRGSRSRGGGRGRPRGSAAAAIAAAYSASDYHMNLYLQQQQQQAAVAGGGDFGRLGGGGSSGLLGFTTGGCSSTPGCGGLEDGGESSAADEQFYAEAYPGKLCALCNFSERSFLGQGEMVRYTVVASEVNLEEYALKRKAAAMETESGGGGAAESGGRKSPTAATTPFKRKVRKFTISGESNPQNGEPPPDELDLIGYQVGVATNLLLFFFSLVRSCQVSIEFSPKSAVYC
jgi:hypothetical protein